MNRIGTAVLLLSLSTASLAQSFTVEDDRTIVLEAGEGQSTVVAPGHPDCPGGRILASQERTPGLTGTVAYHDLDGTVTQISTFADGPAHPEDYGWGTSDHDLVSLSNGDVLYLTGAFSRAKLDPKPAWFDSAYRLTFGPGARSILATWRSTDCGTTFHYVQDLELDPAKMQNGACALPQGKLTHLHNESGSHSYLAPFDAFSQSGDSRFRWCWRCQQLFLADPNQPTACPFGGAHEAGGGIYKVMTTNVADHISETGFKRCKACGVLFKSTSTSTSACEGRKTHDSAGSLKYFLPLAKSGQPLFHRCTKCQAIYKGGIKARCPVGGRHFPSGEYTPPSTSLNFAGETGWKQCAKCGGLFRANQAANICPNGGGHTDAGTSFTMLTAAPPQLPAEAGWRRCMHCGALFQGNGEGASQCPLTRPHDGTGSSSYVLALQKNVDEANLQSGWRACQKCGGLYFAPQVAGGCPIGGEHDTPIYDMGGSDGQLVKADEQNNRLYLTFQCVGRTQDTSFSEFQLSDTPVDKTLIAMADLNQPWKLIGVAGRRDWRIGVVPFDAKSFALGYPSAIVRATATQAAGPFSFEGATSEAAPGQWGWEGVDAKLDPYTTIDANIWAHTIVMRTPGTSNAVLVMPDTIAGKGHGYRIFFHNQAKHSYTEASVPITPARKDPEDVAFHLQAIHLGVAGPALLYWYDYDSDAKTITIRGRFITGEGKYTGDFAISRANGAPRSFSAATETWYGDYQTADGYIQSATAFIFHPMWVEAPTGQVRYGTVRFNPFGAAKQNPILTAVKRVPATRVVSLEKMRRTKQQEEAQREHLSKRRAPGERD